MVAGLRSVGGVPRRQRFFSSAAGPSLLELALGKGPDGNPEFIIWGVDC